MIFRLIITLLPTVLLLVGCGTYTNYSRPASLPVDSLYRDAPLPSPDTASLADLTWRELFTDSVLSRWIERGLQTNSDLQIARLRTARAQASLRASRLAFLPSVSLTPQGTLSRFADAETSKTYSLGGGAEWEIDAFGRLRNALKGSQAALEAERAYEQAIQTQLVATIAELYYSLLMLDSQLAITHRTALEWAENVRAVKALKRAGERNDAAVAQAEASRLDAETSVLALQKQIHETENQFATLMGIAPAHIERGQSLQLALGRQFAVGVPVQLLSRHPDVRQAEWQLAEAFYATGEARSTFYPQITLSGSAGWTNNSGADIVNPGKWLLSAIGSLVQPVFSKGRNRADLQIAKAQQQQAQIAFVQKLLDAGAEVNNALTQWQSAQKKSGTQRPQSRSAPNGRAQHHPADGTRQHKLSGSAHGPPDAPAGTTVRTIRQIRRNSGHHQPLPRPRRRSRITTVKTYFITTKN